MHQTRIYPYAPLTSYPHLSEAEAAIWNRFVQKYPDRFKECLYDYCVGDFRGSENLPPNYAQNRAYLGRYKIDVVGFDEKGATIIEIKKSATTKALGEIWMYEHCWRKDHPGDESARMMIVTDEEMPNMRMVCETDQVELVVV